MKLYVDTCIFIAYYYNDQNDIDNKQQAVKKCLELINKNPEKVTLVTSDFTFTEFVKVLQREKGVDGGIIYKNLTELTRLNKIGKKCQFKLIDVEGKEEKYGFNEFFVGLQDILLYEKSSIADAIHAEIMKNNRIGHILTFDTKDFNLMEDIKSAVHPDKIEDFLNRITVGVSKKTGKPYHWYKIPTEDLHKYRIQKDSQ